MGDHANNVYNVGFSAKDIRNISAEELVNGLADHPNGFVVSGTVADLHSRERKLGIINYRGMVLLHDFVFVEDGIPLLKARVPGYQEGESMVLVSVSEKPQYILFILKLGNIASVADSGFRDMCEEVGKTANSHMQHKDIHTQAFLALSARMQSFYSIKKGNL